MDDGSGISTGNGSERGMAGDEVSVCMDIDAVEGRGMIGEVV